MFSFYHWQSMYSYSLSPSAPRLSLMVATRRRLSSVRGLRCPAALSAIAPCHRPRHGDAARAALRGLQTAAITESRGRELETAAQRRDSSRCHVPARRGVLVIMLGKMNVWIYKRIRQMNLFQKIFWQWLLPKLAYSSGSPVWYILIMTCGRNDQ